MWIVDHNTISSQNTQICDKSLQCFMLRYIYSDVFRYFPIGTRRNNNVIMASKWF